MIAWEFLIELDKIRHSYEWKLVEGAVRPLDQRFQPRLCIRATSRNGLQGSRELLFDPIGAVCYMQAGNAHNPDAWLDSANEIGLSLIAAGDLTAAANDRTWKTWGGRRAHDVNVQKLRDRLLKITRLDRHPADAAPSTVRRPY